MKTKLSVAALAAFVVSGAGMALAHDTSYNLHGPVRMVTTADGVDFRGRVKSEKNACEGDRRVDAYRRRPGDDRNLGHTRSRASGKWQIRTGENLRPGDYYVVVHEKDIGPEGHDHICLGGRSSIIHFE